MNRRGGVTMKTHQILLAILVLWCSQVPVISGVEVETEGYYNNMYGLCIGINAYTHCRGVSPLRSAINDALNFKKVLEECYDFQQITVLQSAEATKARIKESIYSIPKEEQSCFVIYFSGHGQIRQINDRPKSYLLPVDASLTYGDSSDQSKSYSDTCIEMGELFSWLEDCKARHKLLIVDACYSGLFISEQCGIKSVPVPDLLQKNCIEILAAGPGLVRESGKSGVFTSHLINALRTVSPDIVLADINKDGYVLGSEIGNKLSSDHPSKIQPLGFQCYGEGDVVLRPKRPKALAQQPPIDPQPGQEWDYLCPGKFHYPLCFVPYGNALVGTATSEEGRNVIRDLFQSQFKCDTSSLNKTVTDEQALRQVPVIGFWMGKYEVPVGMFQEFIFQTHYKTLAELEKRGYSHDPADGVDKLVDGLSWLFPGFPQDERSPVVCVSWDDSQKLADWAGLSLPTEIQWEYAARGASARQFPWGDKDISIGKCNVSPKVFIKEQWQGQYVFYPFNDGYFFTAPVTSFSDGKSEYGCYNMAGNVSEWVQDQWPRKERDKPERAWIRKGGSWISGPFEIRAASRSKTSEGYARTNYIGIRLCFNVIKPE